jgi:hypothetical protein
MANHVNGYFSFGDIAQRYIGLKNSFLPIANRLA